MISIINLENHLENTFWEIIISTFQTFLGIVVKLMMNFLFSTLVNAIWTIFIFLYNITAAKTLCTKYGYFFNLMVNKYGLSPSLFTCINLS